MTRSQTTPASSQIISLEKRVAELEEENFNLLRKLTRLEEETKGPDEFVTWKDAAINERVRRVTAEKELVDIRHRLLGLMK